MRKRRVGGLSASVRTRFICEERQIVAIGETTVTPLMGRLLQYSQFLEPGHQGVRRLVSNIQLLRHKLDGGDRVSIEGSNNAAL